MIIHTESMLRDSALTCSMKGLICCRSECKDIRFRKRFGRHVAKEKAALS